MPHPIRRPCPSRHRAASALVLACVATAAVSAWSQQQVNLQQDNRVYLQHRTSSSQLNVRQHSSQLMVDSVRYKPQHGSLTSSRYSPGRDRIGVNSPSVVRPTYRPTAPPPAHRDRVVQTEAARKAPPRTPRPSPSQSQRR